MDATARKNDSIVFTAEEADFLKAVLSWEAPSQDGATQRRRRRTVREPPMPVRPANTSPPVGEFRILVIGAKGTGKTSLLTRFCQGRLPSADEPHDPFYEQGCRHVVDLDGQNYTVDALEMPSKHLWRDDVVQQAIHITEAALLVYDVTSNDSLRLARGLHDLIRDTIGQSREYGLFLVGNKTDAVEDRSIPPSEGARTAHEFALKCGFIEVSARGGDNVPTLFPQVGREILKLRWINQQRREQAESQSQGGSSSGGSTDLQALKSGGRGGGGVKRGGFWGRIRGSFSRRGVATM